MIVVYKTPISATKPVFVVGAKRQEVIPDKNLSEVVAGLPSIIGHSMSVDTVNGYIYFSFLLRPSVTD